MTNNKSILEALLFVSTEPLVPAQVKELLDGVTELEVSVMIEELASDYDERGSGIQIAKVAGGYQMMTRLECSPWLRKLKTVTVSNKLSQAALETLAIIAYKQPIIKAELDQIRGVGSDGVLKTLLDRRLIKIFGRKEMPGRPLLYGTATEFLRYFGLRDIAELPTLRDMEDIAGATETPHPSIEEIREMGES
ncbi:MAG: SMC-Scp complex subunit ScpB [Nitrospirae bacterium]|nr:SMC-Scp complex subunit ScpB [Nitrospirota bacterium]